MPKIGIIGGTGIYSPDIFKEKEEVAVSTPYGKTSDMIKIADLENVEIAFIPRHGSGHTIPPHSVNSRANVWALKELGVERIIGLGAVGSLREDVRPGDAVVCDQFIDMTKTRKYSFYNYGKAVHISTADPFCEDMRKLSVDTLRRIGNRFHDKGCYVCIEGPRFSTRAESLLWRSMGGDVIGMTLIPEAVLAKELELCYLSLAMVTDYDAWKERPVTFDEVVRTMKESNRKVMEFLKSFVPLIPKERDCACKSSLEGAV